jgi:CBS domain containing-hemolysin-like protein
MIPRPDIVAFDVATPIDGMATRVARTIHTRFPVYEGTLDHVVGILHLQDLFRRLRLGDSTTDVRPLLRPALVVPESLRMEGLLEQFRRHHTQIALAVDEHGATAGLITLEDVVEEVFGEFQDALEAEQPDIQSMPDGRILVRGEVRVDRVQEELGWVLGDTEAETVGGYVMERLGRVARVADVVETPSGGLRVENMARHRITQVAFIPRPAGGPPG